MFYQSFTFIRVCYCCIVLSAISLHTMLLVAYVVINTVYVLCIITVVVSRRVASHSEEYNPIKTTIKAELLKHDCCQQWHIQSTL